MPATLRARPWAPFPDGPARGRGAGARRPPANGAGSGAGRAGRPYARVRPPRRRRGGAAGFRVGQAPTRKRTKPVREPPAALVSPVSTASTTSMRHLVHMLTGDTACPALDGAA